ncbi:trypsin-like cysteine/serine peptidase domain-containing protein [Cunninghamella echinulata]|nr:trypsin-like cysteine/serine peptidase domain-containing protein [Cunninghamella echinulata]
MLLYHLLFLLFSCILPIDSIFNPSDDFSHTYTHSYFITIKNPILCGGTIISVPTASSSSYLWILTAAHCFHNSNNNNNTSNDDIGLLSIDHPTSSSISFSISKQVYQHPNFTMSTDPLTSLYDLALIQIPMSDIYSFLINHLVRVPILPYSSSLVSVSESNDILECMGVGSTVLNQSTVDNDQGNTLHTTQCYSLPFTSPSSSSLPLNHQADYLSGVLTSSVQSNQTILTTTFQLAQQQRKEETISLCHGDSGSPLIHHHKIREGQNKEAYYFIGVLSRILYATDAYQTSFACPLPSSQSDESKENHLPMVNVFVQPSYHLGWISTITKLPSSFFITTMTTSSMSNTNEEGEEDHNINTAKFANHSSGHTLGIYSHCILYILFVHIFIFFLL